MTIEKELILIKERNMTNPILEGKTPQIKGFYDRKFKSLFNIFEDNLLRRGANSDIGASIYLSIHGEALVDLYGGYQNPILNKEWEEDTLCCCWSVSKTIPALLTIILIDRGLLDIEKPVAYYWPEFGKNNKENILIKHILNHTAALSYLDGELLPGEILNWEKMVKAIENTSPNWVPGEKIGYLNMTFGFLLGELCRRVNGDRKLSQHFKEDISDPFNIDWHFSLDDEKISRVAKVFQSDPNLFNDMILKEPNSIFSKSMKGRNPSEDYNSIEWHKAENGSGTSHTNARAMGRLYNMLSSGKTDDGTILFSDKILEMISTKSIKGIDNLTNSYEMCFSIGFEMNCTPATPMGPSNRSFGYLGAGGSIAFSDPEIKMSFAYSHNFMHMGVGPGPCGLPLVEEVISLCKKL